MPARILVIEDNPANLELVTYLLRAFGHTPLAATDGREGMAIARQERPDLVLCDVHVPEMDGYEFARRLRADPRLRKTPLVAVTGLAMVGDRERILAAGFNAYVAKPIVPETFVTDLDPLLPEGLRSSPESAAHAALGSAGEPAHRVLLLDDSPVDVVLARVILEPLGYLLEVVTEAQEGLERMRSGRPDVLLADLEAVSGTVDVLAEIRRDPRLAGMAVVIITSKEGLENDPAILSRLDGAGLIVRPLEQRTLAGEIERRLRGKVN